jgi:hypothetical protein
MCSPVQTPVDPALASVLINLCVSRALHDLERLGVGPARGGSCRVEYREGRAVPGRECRPMGGQQLRRLHSSIAVPAAAAISRVREEHLRGTATMLRSTAHEAVRRRTFPPLLPLRTPSLPPLTSFRN